MLRASFILCSASVLSIGCMQVTAYTPTTVAVSDEPQLATLLASGDYHGSGFTQMNQTPFASGINGALVTFFVSNDAAAAYEAITPETTSAKVDFPVGGVIVREVDDAQGNATLLTVMMKREPGYFPAVGDFFFGVTDPSGTPEVQDGVPEWGAVAACATCHEPRAAAAYLFGVSIAHRK